MPENRYLYAGMIRLHILHQASKGAVFGLWIIQELGRHGSRLSPGTLYPVLHSLAQRGLLRSADQREAGRRRRLYRITPAGRRALAAAKEKVRELFAELFEDEDSPARRRGRRVDGPGAAPAPRPQRRSPGGGSAVKPGTESR
jgi:DNA-binding PadR family transcriptional regulator